MRTYLRNDRLDAQSLRFLAQGVVRNLIGNMVLLEEADALGLSPDDEELAAWIKRQLSPGGVSSASNNTKLLCGNVTSCRFPCTRSSFVAV